MNNKFILNIENLIEIDNILKIEVLNGYEQPRKQKLFL
jgi:hypothetical protein